MNWIDYRERLGIGFSDAEKFGMLKNKLLNFLEYSYDDIYSRKSCLEYLFITCERIDDPSDLKYTLQESFESSSSLAELIYKYIVFYNSYSSEDPKYNDEAKQQIINVLKRELTSLRIQYELFKDEDGLFVFPKGAKEFDDALVSQPLEWLTQYPQAHKTFCIALRQYSDGLYIRDVADNLRKALEEFMRELLGNSCDFSKNTKNIESYLKSQNADSQLINMFRPLLNYYYLMNNDIAKHNDKVDAKYLEFLMYQTGIFIRMLIVVKQANEEANHAD